MSLETLKRVPMVRDLRVDIRTQYQWMHVQILAFLNHGWCRKVRDSGIKLSLSPAGIRITTMCQKVDAGNRKQGVCVLS